MDQTRTKRMVDTALIAAFALSGLGASIPTARGDEVPNLAITAAEENDAYGPLSVFRSEGTPSDSIDENLSNEGVAMPSEEGSSDLQDDSEKGKETEESSAIIVGSTIRVSTIGQLKKALTDSTYEEIVLEDNVTSISEDLSIDRDVMLDLNGKGIAFTSNSEGKLHVTTGVVEIRNGRITSHSSDDNSAAIVIDGGTLTVSEGLYVDSQNTNTVLTRGNSTLVIDDATLVCQSAQHSVIKATETSKVDGEDVELRASGNSTAVTKDSSASVSFKFGTYYTDYETQVSPYIASGYKLTSTRSGLYRSKGDINGTLAAVRVNPLTYTYDGESKEPTVTVTFDSEDVTNECQIAYENNIGPGTATVKITAMENSDTITGETSRTFTIEPDDTDDDPIPTPSPSKQVTASTYSELKRYLEDPTIKKVILLNNISANGRDIDISHDVELDLYTFELNLGTTSTINVSKGDVVVSNGEITSSSKTAGDAVIKQSGGNLTLGKNLKVNSYDCSGVRTSGKADLTIDGVRFYGGSANHPLIVATEDSKITAENITLSPKDNVTPISEQKSDQVNIKLGNLFVNSESTVAPYIANGYKLIKAIGFYQSMGDISGSLATITVNPDTYTYDSEYKEPTVTVTFDGEDVTKDCSITYKNNKNPGTATVNIRAMATSDKITGETTRDFKIEQGTIDGSNADISLATTSYTYNGSKHEPHVTVKVNGSTVLNTNYTVSYSNNINAGTATATVTFKSDSGYTGTVTKDFTINQKEATVTPNSKSKRAGESDPELTATVTGTVGSDKLSYKLSRNSGESTGTYTITASGNSSQGNYKVTFKTGTFTITGSNSTSSTTTTSSTSSNNNKSNGNTTTSTSTNTTKSNSSTPASSSSSSIPAASTGSSSATKSTGATNSTGTTGTTGAATATKAASTGTAAPVAKTPATADPSFVGFGTLVSGALAALGIGLGTKRRSKE